MHYTSYVLCQTSDIDSRRRRSRHCVCLHPILIMTAYLRLWESWEVHYHSLHDPGNYVVCFLLISGLVYDEHSQLAHEMVLWYWVHRKLQHSQMPKRNGERQGGRIVIWVVFYLNWTNSCLINSDTNSRVVWFKCVGNNNTKVRPKIL
jgi:hypothetical protein